MKKNTLLLAVIVGASALAAISCTVMYSGPPPAAAHGQVVVHGGTNLVFDADLGLYLVTGYPDYYYFDGYYYHVYERGHYERCRTIDGSWRSVSSSSLPPGLAKKYGEEPREHRGRGHEKQEEHHGHDD